jgi:hypothetical protein
MDSQSPPSPKLHDVDPSAISAYLTDLVEYWGRPTPELLTYREELAEGHVIHMCTRS